MFFGEHEHSLDAKGRIVLPARFRDQLERAYITCEVDGCLAVWAPDDFEVRSREMREKARGNSSERQMARAFFSGAAELPPDGQGRLAIPGNLREYARLTRQVVICGQFDHVEIWDADLWRQEKSKGNQALLAGNG